MAISKDIFSYVLQKTSVLIIGDFCSKNRVAQAIASQQRVDPEVIFPPESFCSIAQGDYHTNCKTLHYVIYCGTDLTTILFHSSLAKKAPKSCKLNWMVQLWKLVSSIFSHLMTSLACCINRKVPCLLSYTGILSLFAMGNFIGLNHMLRQLAPL